MKDASHNLKKIVYASNSCNFAIQKCLGIEDVNQLSPGSSWLKFNSTRSEFGCTHTQLKYFNGSPNTRKSQINLGWSEWSKVIEWE